MDPYTTLGISQHVTEDELKRAFRKKAMECHPDRAGSSPEAKERFFGISQAYKAISKELKNKARLDQTASAHKHQSDKTSNFHDVYWKEVLEYASDLAESGYTKEAVRVKVAQKGCDEKMARLISDQAFKMQDKFKSRHDVDEIRGNKYAGNIPRKFNYQSIAALLGEQNAGRSGLSKTSYYLDAFNELYADIESGAIFPTSKNRYLSKIFNLAIVLFLLFAASVYYLPVVYKFIPLGPLDLFQLPNIILSFMLVWSVYRKLWLLSLIGIAIFSATQTYYYYSMPVSLEEDYSSILLTSFICYLPFIMLSRGANFFFYVKTKNIIEAVDLHYSELEEKLILIRNSGGVSRISAFIVVVLLSFYFLYMIPEKGSLYKKYNWLVYDDKIKENKDFKHIQSRESESDRLYKLAEENFNRNPPQYEQAKISYMQAAEYGSLLSYYKLGFMFFVGKGGVQDDKKAFYYFNKAVNSPLANQPHNLSLVTKWLSESYRSLGIMYLGGYGTAKNHQKAQEMFSQAIKYGASNGIKNLMHIEKLKNQNLRIQITLPEYGQ